MLLSLALANLRVRKVRTLLTVLAIALAVSLVVAVTSGYASVTKVVWQFMDQYFGAVDMTIYRGTDPREGIDGALIDELRADRNVRDAWGRIESDATIPRIAMNSRSLAHHAKLNGIDLDRDPIKLFGRIDQGRWFKPGEIAGTVDEGMIAQGFPLGSTFNMPGPHGALNVPIVGVVHRPGPFAMLSLTLYVPLKEAQRFIYGTENRVTKISLQLQAGVDHDAFAKKLTARLKQIDPLLKLQTSQKAREGVERNVMGIRLMSMMGGTVSMVAAMFIIFTTLSMGVAERQRTLAMMRAVGLYRSQLGKLVVMEGVAIAFIGICVGIPLGYLWTTLIFEYGKDFLNNVPVRLDLVGVTFATIGSLIAAVLASLMPAFFAMRVSPLEAMTPLAQDKADRLPWRVALLGVVLIALDPIILHLPVDASPVGRAIRFYGHFSVGLPLLLVGFFLMAPMIVWIIARVIAPVLGFILRIPAGILRGQLSTGLWRSAGTCAALMVGLSVLVVMQTHANSMINGWKIPTRFPDVFIFTKGTTQFSPEMQQRAINNPLLVPEDVMPIALFKPELGDGVMGVLGLMLPNATTFVAVDPDKALRLLELDFRQGTPEEATRLLKQGKHLIVTEEFHQLKGLGVGDKFALNSATKGKVEYTICGVVWSPGIDVMASTVDMGSAMETQASGSVFGTLADAKEDFGVDNALMLTGNFRQLGVEKETLVEKLKTDMNNDNLGVADVRELKRNIIRTAQKILAMASGVAWAALLVAAVGVVNTIIASVRSRLWSFGVMRAIGTPRGLLLRLVLAEGLMLGCAGVVMGLLAGLEMCFNARTVLTLTLGHYDQLLFPWPIITLGCGIVLAVSLLASLLPAIRLARTEPLKLLQAGRAAGG